MITSSTNQHVKDIIQLNQKSKARSKMGVFVVEGERAVSEVPERLLERIYVSESFFGETMTTGKLDALNFDASQIEVVADDVFKIMSDTQTPQGILAVVKQPKYELMQLYKGDSTHLLILENVQDPGNLGTMMRTAEGAGATGVVMTKETVDLFNPKTVRATMGSIYRMPFYVTDDLEGTVNRLKSLGVRVYAAYLGAYKTYDQINYGKGLAFMIGNEGNGLSSHAAGLADELISIPMSGQLESLNAAMAAGILMYEVRRQRQ